MNEYALESFISSCDNMMIAEESNKENAVMALLIAACGGIIAWAAVMNNKINKREKEKSLNKNAEEKANLEKWVNDNRVTKNDKQKWGRDIQNDLYKTINKMAQILKKDYPNQIQKCFKLEKSEYSDYGIQITEYQSGLDSDAIYDYEKAHPDIEYNDIPKELTDNSWYNKLLKAGEIYVNEKYKYAIKYFDFIVNTGDGDEGNIYIDE